jgi:hypothetical protein
MMWRDVAEDLVVPPVSSTLLVGGGVGQYVAEDLVEVAAATSLLGRRPAPSLGLRELRCL